MIRVPAGVFWLCDKMGLDNYRHSCSMKFRLDGLPTMTSDLFCFVDCGVNATRNRNKECPRASRRSDARHSKRCFRAECVPDNSSSFLKACRNTGTNFTCRLGRLKQVELLLEKIGNEDPHSLAYLLRVQHSTA